ncbi:MAG: hypothetical protein KJ811_04595, partial [Candidatus Margulisbacteria bacterium]|nr:hypothetical protein [Candidatus Margulisiibacteriota bacterium]
MELIVSSKTRGQDLTDILMRFFIAFCLIVVASPVFSMEYSPMREILETSIGSKEGQVFFKQGTVPSFAEKNNGFVVDYDGAILVSDTRNGKVEKFSPKKGHLFSLKIKSYVKWPYPYEVWPYELTFDKNNNLYVEPAYLSGKA